MKYLLKGGIVADGERREAFRADVLTENGIIAESGDIDDRGDAVVLDCSGMVITAGFVDAHMHVESSMVLPSAFGAAVLPWGTTSVIADPHEIVNVAGAAGLDDFLNMTEKAPINVFASVPSCVPATPLDTNGAGRFTAEDMRPFAGRRGVVGLGEVMDWGSVVRRDGDMMAKIMLFAGKTADGHTAGMPDDLLPDYAAACIRNDHECTDGEGLIKRYLAGLNVYIREGSAAHNADVLLRAVKEYGADTSRFALCTDDKHLADIAREGHISHIAAMARQLGFGIGDTARMASYNACRYYGLERRGNIRPGYIADIVVTDENFSAIRYVLKDGELVAENAKPLFDVDKYIDKGRVFANTVKMRKFTAEDFVVPERLRGTALGLVDGQILTERRAAERCDRTRLNMLATAERHGKNGNLSVCLLDGYGIRNGAVASTVSHDSHNAVCAGDNGADMAVALNRAAETGGGYVAVSGGRVVAEIPLPAYGLMSVESAAETARLTAAFEEKVYAMGVNRGIDAMMTLSFAALPVIPRLRLLDTGLYDVEEGRFL